MDLDIQTASDCGQRCYSNCCNRGRIAVTDVIQIAAIGAGSFFKICALF